MSFARVCGKLTQGKHDKISYKKRSTKKKIPFLFFQLRVSFVHRGLVLTGCDQEDENLNDSTLGKDDLQQFKEII